jgi:ubiquinone/menaquinone biosynthesis C-methylase UbiE
MDQAELGATFRHAGVAAAYRYRPPYPEDVFDRLEELIVDEPRAVLDIGAGEGAIARPLAARVEWVDAVDISAAMIDAGRGRPGGDRPNLRWYVDAVETAELQGPYALVTAGASLHWMRGDETMARLAEVMTPNAQLAVITHGPQDVPWREDLVTVIKRHSRSPGYDPNFRVVDSLRERGLLEVTGSATSTGVQFSQSVSDYIEQFHSTAALAREHMSPEESAAFDAAIEEVVRPWADADGTLTLTIVADLTWGRPSAQTRRG